MLEYKARLVFMVETLGDDTPLSDFARSKHLPRVRAATVVGDISTHYFDAEDALVVRRFLASQGEEIAASRDLSDQEAGPSGGGRMKAHERLLAVEPLLLEIARTELAWSRWTATSEEETTALYKRRDAAINAVTAFAISLLFAEEPGRCAAGATEKGE